MVDAFQKPSEHSDINLGTVLFVAPYGKDVVSVRF